MADRVATSKAERDTIMVRVSLMVRQRGGRKTVTDPHGRQTFIPAGSNGDGALVKAVARAFRWRTLIETGAHASIADLAAAEEVNPSYASRVLRLALLAPEIMEMILDHRRPPSITLDRLMRPFPVAWEQQRSTFNETCD